MVLHFSIEGNIGSGKSTFINILKDKVISAGGKKIIYLPEPVDVWNEIKDLSGVTILEKYYANPDMYAFSFQMMAYISRLSQIKNYIKKGAVIITERCVFTDYNVFAKMLYDSSKITHIEYLIYKKWFDEFVNELPEPKIIYIQTSPETCLKRVKKRNRKGETIQLEYLKTCHEYHEEWINNSTNEILTLDGECEFISVSDIAVFISQNLK